MSIPWRELIRGAIDLGAIIVGAILADRQQKAAAQAPKASAPTPRPRAPEPSFPARADADITSRGHAAIDERFRTQPPPSGPVSEPLPGSALRGEVPVDPDPTEPEGTTVPPPAGRR